MAKENIAGQVAHLIQPTVEQMGYTLWDVEYTKEGADWHLVITIDKEEGMAGDGGARTAAVLLLDDLTELVDGHLATTDLKEGAHDSTHHVA